MSMSFAPSTCTVLDVRDLRKHFVLHAMGGRRVDALCGVDLRVNEGEHVALAGSSGAGKSTLLKSIYRTYLPSSGSVLFHRRPTGAGGGVADVAEVSDVSEVVDLTSVSDAALAILRGREIGYVSQFLRAEPRRGALDIVARAGVRRGMPRDEAREAAVQALRRLNIDEPLWDVYASVLSGGEKQRVNLAAGIISPPRLLLLDEPVSALDPANREAALDLIAELTGQGVAVVAVFHDLEAMERLATRVVLLRDGRVELSGDPTTVLARLTGVAR